LFYFINHYVDILNYTNPFKKYFYFIETFLTKNSLITNNLNFNPSIVRTHNGLIFDNIEEKNAHVFDRNDVFTVDKNDIFIAYVFSLRNIVHFNERIYKRIPDVISSIGGVYQFITIISMYINSLYNNYIVISDTENLLHSSIHSEKHINKKIEKRKEKEIAKIEKIKEIDNKKKNKNEKNNSLAQKVKNEKPNRIKNTKLNNNSQNSNCFVSSEKINTNIDIKIPIDNKIKDDNFEKNRTLKRGITHFFDFFLHEISCKKKKHFFKVYTDFRIKIISEEHLIRNHLNVYNLLRVTERKRHYRRNSYKINDVIKLL